MRKGHARGYIESQIEFIIGGLIFGVTLLIFWFSPVYQVTDSAYSMVLSQSLLEHHSFTLDHYALPRTQLQDHWQLELVDGHLYYRYPPGTSVLSLPFVAIMRAFHTTSTNADGTYKPQGEIKVQATLASLLMALLAGIFFFTSRLLLPKGWSVLTALGGALGTQVWSTASRAMWSHTWEVLLLGLVVWMLLAHETGRRDVNPWVLATLLAWTYFVRPTASIPILAITVYVGLFYPRLFIKYAVAGVAWLVVFIAYSYQQFGQVLPNYYRMSFIVNSFWIGLAGVLISPSRGLLVYVPVLLFLVYLVVRYWRYIALRRLVWLALSIIIAHLIVVSASPQWWGGVCFGARLTTDLVPWFVMLSILSINAMLRWRTEQSIEPSSLTWWAPLALGSVLLMLSVFINGRGALSRKTWQWATAQRPEREWMEVFWDWRYPQFLAGLIAPPLRRDFPPLETHIALGGIESEKYIWYGWGVPETKFRWTDGHQATLIFGLDEINDAVLQIKCVPFLPSPKVAEQNVSIELNGNHLTTLTMREPVSRVYSIEVPRNLLRGRNVLQFDLPNASSLQALRIGEDSRLLGLAVEWIELQSQRTCR